MKANYGYRLINFTDFKEKTLKKNLQLSAINTKTEK